MQLNLEEALARIDAGIAKAEEMDIRVAFAIVDQFGMIVQVDRMDGAPPMSPDVAEAKALTALNFQRSTDAVSRIDRDVVKMIKDVVNFQIVAVPGGAPILSGKYVRGAVGVSGASPEQEHEIAAFVAGDSDQSA